jgi:hypothetical protein
MIPASGADVWLLGVTNVIEKTALISRKPRELKALRRINHQNKSPRGQLADFRFSQ